MARGTLATLILAALVVGTSWWTAKALQPDGLRHPGICGIEFLNGELHVVEDAATVHGLALEHRPSRVILGPERGLVMQLDHATDYVDFELRIGGQPGGTARTRLVAFDARGRVVDVDEGPAAPGRLVTMQVTTDEAVIQRVRLELDRPDGPTRAVVAALDAGTGGTDCPIRS